MRRGLAALFGLIALAAGAAAAQAPEWLWPAGIVAPAVPADNPMSAAKVELGRRLFYDADLSLDGTLACSNCHVQKHAFADSIPTRGGVGGGPGRRNAPGLANVAYFSPLTWADPRLATLEGQFMVPVFGDHPVEMGMKGQDAEVVRRLSRDDCYQEMFRQAFPAEHGAIGNVTIGKALAAFERSLLSYNSPYDRDRAGRKGLLSDQAMRGKQLFGAQCAACHAGLNLTDMRFHAIEHGISAADPGLAEVTGKPEDGGKFRTPSLRNVALTAPYLHDGSAATLADAIHRHAFVVPAAGRFTPEQTADLIAWLDAFTDADFVHDPKFAYPERICGKPS
jgi:cytochrome c peroxidase